MKKRQINDILLYRIEKTKILTKITPESARFKRFDINYKSSNNNKYKFFALVLP